MVDFISAEEIKKRKYLSLRNVFAFNIVGSDNKVRDSLGRATSLSDWALREYRTSTANDLLDNTKNLMEEYEHDEVFVDDLGDSSDLCYEYQNSCYSLSGKTYPDLDSALWSGGGGLLHPNCRHTIEPYFRGITTLEKNSLGKKEVEKNRNERSDYVRTSKQLEGWQNKYDKAVISGIDTEIYERKINYWSGRLEKLPTPDDGSFLINV